MIREELEHLLDLVRFAEHDMECTKEEEIPNVKEKLIQKYEGLEEIEKLVKSESVRMLLRYGTKCPSSSGMDEIDDDSYLQLYRISQTPPPEQTGTLLNDKETK